ncbi:NAD(P)/FAD-dependent oxidoreductase [Bacillus marasmi]|uniref:NAD(P)/FAD-dependent oxidoreductase n=1 Tax=Bacillus marasmi TaxID=1926279 RepID=UPI0011C7AE40|nr:NAD(P)/FAD-dependent oxidoreductase [Bacillus marasmi]
MNYRYLFEKGKIGQVTLRNRLIMPAMGTGLAGPDGEMTDHVIAYYEERAKGGTGLIITEYTSVDYKLGRANFNQLRIDEDRFLPGFYRLANAVHKYGAKIFVQLQHPGRETTSYTLNGQQIVAPSPVACAAIGEVPRELTTEEVKGIVNQFVMGALRCKMAGVDGVELHGAHGYLINQFMSPGTNLRTDEYGGSFKNRMRFSKEIVEGIKAKCGQDFPVSIRISVDEYEKEGGLTIELSQKVARYLEEVGYDAIHASCGNYNSMDKMVESMMFEQGWRVPLAEAVKQVVSIPVVAVGTIREPEFAEGILAAGKADFIAMGRGHIADPEWAKKALEGRESEIRKCINCLNCTRNPGHIKCSLNIRAGRELEFKEIHKIEEKRHVAIVGGGPGGMETARVLRLKGYDVTIFEKDSKLGGQLNLVKHPTAKEKMNWMIDYHCNEMKRLNVDVRFNTEASFEAINDLKPYAVFIATGAKPIIPNIIGHNLPNVCDYEDVLLERKEFVNKKMVVMGSGMVCYSITGQLAKQGNDVTLIEVPTETGSKVTPHTRAMLLNRLKNENVNIIEGKEVVEIHPQSVIVSDENGQHSEINLDYFVFSMGTESYNPLEELYKQHFENVFVIGDAINPGSITNAIKDGFEHAYVLESIVTNKVDKEVQKVLV